MYEALLFDNDGVLTVPTDRELMRSAVRTAFANVGVAAPDEAHIDDLLAGVDPDWLAETCAGYGVDPVDFWYERDRAAFLAQREAVRAGEKPAYDDVTALADLDVPLGVVSSNQQLTVEFLLDHHGLADAFDTHYGREPTLESLRRKKPEPYYLERALDDLAVDGPALYVGDRASDIAAATNAGLDSAFVRRPHTADTALPVAPTHEIETLADLPALVAGDD
jgi:phosphoglycolate phosphatase-like HAD superfamily hydrolase